MKNKRRNNRVVGILLAVCMLFGMMPQSILAAEMENMPEQSISANTVEAQTVSGTKTEDTVASVTIG